MAEKIAAINKNSFLSNKQPQEMSFGGLTVFADAYVLNGSELMFLSIFGNKTSVRGIWSSLMAGKWIEHAHTGAVHVNPDHKWRVHAKVLPSKIAHAILIPQQLNLKQINNEFLFIAGEGGMDRFFLYLNRASKVPLKREWSKWLFNKAKAEEMLTELTCLNLEAYH
jgi:hypothetical protein